jgi:glycosyltransferase involved in cell wall biosynthesis
MSLVSVVMPTYNRADTIERAIRSVVAQTYCNWELLVVDDGSTDDTAELIQGIDSRVKIIKQENRGFVGARNRCLQESRGKYIAFLDSDDEWLPYHLELCIGFLEASPDAQFVASELIEDFGQGRIVNHYRAETSERYPTMASKIRSNGFARKPGQDDDYLRVYERRTLVGEWGKEVLQRARITDDVYVYSGRIYPHLRWGYLIAVNSLVLRRNTFETVGLQDSNYNIAADYHYVAMLCRDFEANFIGTPTYVKHELTGNGQLPASTHIATGITGYLCAKDMLSSFEDLFWKVDPEDPELRALHGLKLYETAQIALHYGEREAALGYLKNARKRGPYFFRVLALQAFVLALRQPELTRKAYVTLYKVSYAGKQVFKGELSFGGFMRKAFGLFAKRTVYDSQVVRLLFLLPLAQLISSVLADTGSAFLDASDWLG